MPPCEAVVLNENATSDRMHGIDGQHERIKRPLAGTSGQTGIAEPGLEIDKSCGSHFPAHVGIRSVSRTPIGCYGGFRWRKKADSSPGPDTRRNKVASSRGSSAVGGLSVDRASCGKPDLKYPRVPGACPTQVSPGNIQFSPRGL